jgi:hypothetical protein
MDSIFYLSLKKKIFKHFNKIFFVEDENITYFNHSHKNYIYTEKIGNLIYTFHGFYKDDHFVIVIDSYDEELDINIEHKEVILLKVQWILKEVKNDIQNMQEREEENNKFIWSIDGELEKKYETYYFILPIRSKLLNSCILDIEDFKNVTKYDEHKLSFSIIDKKKYEENKKNDLFKKFWLLCLS